VSTASPPISAPRLPDRRTSDRGRLIVIGGLILFGALLAFSWVDTHGSIKDFVNSFFAKKGLIRDVAPSAWPPKGSEFWPGVKAAMTTFAIAYLSIVFGLIGALALLPFAARNIAGSRVLYEIARLVMAILRAIPELILFLILTITLGLTEFSTVVALSFHGVGVMGKLFAEAVEEMDMAPVHALRVAGASRIQIFVHAVIPETRNTLLGLTLYRLDGNFRSAVTLGAVGGGGIGFLINNELEAFQYKPVLTYLIIMVVFVLAIERVSTILRRNLT
jgi:phosphonate transport system permease protein